MIKERFRENMTRLMNKHKLSIEDLSFMSGVPEDIIMFWLALGPISEDLEQVCKVLNCEVSDLFVDSKKERLIKNLTFTLGYHLNGRPIPKEIENFVESISIDGK